MLFDIGSFLDQFSAPQPRDAENLFSTKRRAWHQSNNTVARCDFAPRKSAISGYGFKVLSLWSRSIYGPSLTDIKADPEKIPFFIENMTQFIRQTLGTAMDKSDWAIVTPPPRRHKERNFAQSVADGIAANLGIPHIADVAESDTRQRVNVDFRLRHLPRQQNLLIFDDIITTGSTFMSMNRLLTPHGKTLLFVAAIKNS